MKAIRETDFLGILMSIIVDSYNVYVAETGLSDQGNVLTA